MTTPTINFAGSFDGARNDARILTGLRQHPTERVIQIRQRSPFDRIVVMRAAQLDDAFFSGVRLNHEAVKTGRNDFILFGEQKDCRRASRSRVCNAVKILRDL